jgi:hypothetical protein
MTETQQPADTLIAPRDPKSSAVILDALNDADKAFRDYNEICRRIDAIYSARSTLTTTAQDMGLTDQEYDTFWSSMEVLKPAIYAKPPKVVAKPRFSDASPTDKVVAELIERVVNSEFERGNVDLHLKECRDDLALLNRGVLRVTYEDQQICIDHVDRLEYRHEPVRYWHELGWEAFGAWLTEDEMKERFGETSGEAYKRAGFISRKDGYDDENTDSSLKALVWEVWSKTDGKVYWVSEGVDVILDEDEPYLSLKDFFPGPRPAYGTLRRRTLVPVPDYVRYERHLEQINFLTSRIYALLERCRVVGLFSGAGDVGTALQTAISETTDAMFIPVPAGLTQSGGGDLVQWLPIDVIANTITGLIQARNQLFADFDRLSGISDIMRGETEADETLGAQRLKSQYGSIRVKDKVDEIVRLARDTARIAVEIVCQNFTQRTLLDVSQMDIPTRRDVEKDIDGIKKAAKAEMEALTKKAQEAAQQAQQGGQQVDPAQAQQQFQQAQQEIAQKYAPQLQSLQNTVVIEDVMKVIKDKRERALIIDIETDSTVLVDEIAEKQMRNELLQTFAGAMQQLQPLFALGDVGVKLATGMLEFTLQPYVQGNRQIQQLLDDMVEQAPEIAAKMAAQAGGGDSAELAEAQKGLAEAEKVKAQAAMASVQAKAALDQAQNQLKMADLQQRAQSDAQKAQIEMGKLQAAMQKQQQDASQRESMQQAQIDNLTAQTAQILHAIGLDERKQQLDEYTAADDAQAKRTDQILEAQRTASDVAATHHGMVHAERQQKHVEESSSRQQDLAERTAMQGDD